MVAENYQADSYSDTALPYSGLRIKILCLKGHKAGDLAGREAVPPRGTTSQIRRRHCCSFCYVLDLLPKKLLLGSVDFYEYRTRRKINHTMKVLEGLILNSNKVSGTRRAKRVVQVPFKLDSRH